jgi:N-acetyl-gamma-glutamyl-phosphate reductase
LRVERVRLAIIGVSGYAGAELAMLCSEHPAFSLRAAVADRWQGEALGACTGGVRGPARGLRVVPMRDAAAAALSADVALLATPAEVSAQLAPELLVRGVRVVDLSGAFRLTDPAAYPRWYGFTHPAPELLAEARYGLPEVPGAAGDAPRARTARLVANPGCYATAAILALAPLVARRAVALDALFADGKSGVTGAGRKVEERLLFNEIAENLSPYRVGNHQHAPEIELVLSRVAGAEVKLTFTPHLLPIRRGLTVTAYGRLAEGVDAAAIEAIVAGYFPEGGGEVRVVAPEAVTIGGVAGTNRALVGARGDADRRTAVAIASLDNLRKGAASQALQNLCEMVGVPFSPEERDEHE